MPSTVRQSFGYMRETRASQPTHAGIFFWRLDIDVVRRLRLFKNATFGFRPGVP